MSCIALLLLNCVVIYRCPAMELIHRDLLPEKIHCSIVNTERPVKLRNSIKSLTSRKRSVFQEGRAFNVEWEIEYFCTSSNNGLLCLICHKSIAARKEYNARRHYISFHGDWDEKYPKKSDARAIKLSDLKSGLAKQQKLLTRHTVVVDTVTEASYKIGWQLAKARKPFIDGELIKECIDIACKVVLPDKPEVRQLMKKIPLSRNTIASRIEEASRDIERQIKDDIGSCSYYSLALDESTDICDKAQLVIFIRFMTLILVKNS
jgi:hypothetical protein